MSDNNFTLFHYSKVSSTMDTAAQQIKYQMRDKTVDNFVVITDAQTAGRGRLDRTWHSPEGNFYATYALNLPNQSALTGMYAIATASALAECFNQINISVRLKWPNDIFLNDAKLGGILIELTDSNYILIGTGINICSHPIDQVLKPSISLLKATNKIILPLDLHNLFKDKLYSYLNLVHNHETHEIFKTWQKYCLHHQQMVSVRNNKFYSDESYVFRGYYRGLDKSGALILEDLQTGMHRLIYTGDIF